MKKIILKYKLADRDSFEDELSARDFDFSALYWQHDRVYVPRGFKRAQNFPRLVMRTEMRAVDAPPKYSLILRRHIEDSGVDIVEETPVTDYVGTVNIILQLGFKPAGEVSRRRQDLEMEEGTKVYLDILDGRDEYYAKIETDLKEDDSVEKVRSELEKTMKNFGDLIESAYFEL